MLPFTQWTNENGLNPKFGNDCLFVLSYQNQIHSVKQKHRGYYLFKILFAFSNTM